MSIFDAVTATPAWRSCVGCGYTRSWLGGDYRCLNEGCAYSVPRAERATYAAAPRGDRPAPIVLWPSLDARRFAQVAS